MIAYGQYWNAAAQYRLIRYFHYEEGNEEAKFISGFD